MKATIRIVTAEKEFREDQIKIIRRIMMVLQEHNLSVSLNMKIKTKIVSGKKYKIKIA